MAPDQETVTIPMAEEHNRCPATKGTSIRGRGPAYERLGPGKWDILGHRAK